MKEQNVEIQTVNKCQTMITLIDSWLNDDSIYDEESWLILKKSLNEDRLSDRKLFSDKEFLINYE